MKGKPAARAAPTSDVTRPRTLAVIAVGAALGVGVAVYAGKTPTGNERPLARPHAKVACAKCHESPDPTVVGFEKGAACKNCHGGSHGSARSAHRALAQKGELSCATCHPAHAGVQGVSFTANGAIRWGAGAEQPIANAPPVKAGTNVPLVSLAVCAKCHDLARASDPIAACVPGGKLTGDPKKVVSQCAGEHRALNVAGPADGVCKAQHGADRFAAEEAARQIAATTPWVAPARAESPPWLPLGGAALGASMLGGLAFVFERRRRRAPAAARATTPITAPPAKKRLPVVDTSTCLGCYACVDACPFDVLEIQKYVAVVARPEECCGVVLCEQVCPNGSLRIDEGDLVSDRPEVDEHLESRDVPGMYLAGDLTGLPLIKNAINQGVRAVDRIAATLPRKRTTAIDVVVIGAGPAGLSAALRAKEKGLACVVLEQATVAASVKSFPRDKIVHDPPLDLPVEGELWLREATKEELVAQWTRIVRARALDVRESHRVTAITKSDDGSFTVTASDTTFRGARVVLAIGRRGTPRKLDLAIDAGADERVLHSLADARSFEGKRVVIAGLGDSAMEAAIAIARQPGADVTVVYRGTDFKRGKSRNVAEMKKLVADAKVKLLFGAVPTSVSKTHVTLSNGARLRADALFVLVGGLPSWDLMTRAGIVRRGPDPALKGENLRDPET